MLRVKWKIFPLLDMCLMTNREQQVLFKSNLNRFNQLNELNFIQIEYFLD